MGPRDVLGCDRRWAEDFFLEREYPDLEHFAKELEARDADFEFMKAMRESYKHVVQGSVKIELFQEAVPPKD